MDGQPPKIRTSPLTQAGWIVFQTAIVGVVLLSDYEMGNPPRPGLALALGIGWALSATVLLHLTFNGLRRAVNALRRVKHEKPRQPLALGGRLRTGQPPQKRRGARISYDPR